MLYGCSQGSLLWQYALLHMPGLCQTHSVAHEGLCTSLANCHPRLATAYPLAGKLVMGAGIIWFSLASALLPAVAITPWTAAAGLTLPAVLAARFLVGFGEGARGRAAQPSAGRFLGGPVVRLCACESYVQSAADSSRLRAPVATISMSMHTGMAMPAMNKLVACSRYSGTQHRFTRPTLLLRLGFQVWPCRR